MHNFRPKLGCRDYNNSIHNQNGEHGGEGHEPEPYEDIGFLIHDVERKDAQTVVFLNASRSTVFVEYALGDPGEDVNHRVNSIFLRGLREVHYTKAVR